MNAMLVRVSEYRYDVFGLIGITLFGPWRWQVRDLGVPNGAGFVFGCYPPDDSHEVAHLVVGDATDDPDEPDTLTMTTEMVAVFDRFLQRAIREQMALEGRRLVRWMSSQMNNTPSGQGVVTAYVAEDQGRERQHIDARLSIRGRKVFLSGCFDIARADELAQPIVTVLRQVIILNPARH